MAKKLNMAEIADENKWAVKYRPQSLSEIIGQDQAVSVIEGMFRSGNVARSLLISGNYGSGKTTLARIYARMVNAVDDNRRMIDIQEFDAANNRGIDDIRNIVDNLKFAPQQAKYKVIILDEMHMLTPQAITALLKPLEEPAPHVVWVLCTNEPHKLPQTIHSRCVHINLKSVSPDDIIIYLKRICKAEKFLLPTKSKETSQLLKRVAEAGGSPRTCVSLLQKVSYILASKRTKVITDETLSSLAEELETPDETAAVMLSGILQASFGKGNEAARLTLVKAAIKHLSKVKDFNTLVRSLIDLNSYLIDSECGAWTYPSLMRGNLGKLLKQKGIRVDLAKTIHFHKLLADLQPKLMWTGVDWRVQLVANISDFILAGGRQCK